jgi:hypothetical protein
MALVELYHVVADFYDVNSAADVVEGMFLQQNSSGELILATGGAGTKALGVAGDTKSTAPGMPKVNGSSDNFVNRVSDPFVNESSASGKMTVYHSGGKFATDQYDDGVSYTVGDDLFVGSDGKLTSASSANSQVVATVVAVPGPFDSGVPGTTVNGSLSLGTYLVFKLEI